MSGFIKRLTAFFIAVLLVLPLALCTAEATSYAQNPFEKSDENRRNAIEQSLGKNSTRRSFSQYEAFSSAEATGNEKTYMVSFNGDVSLSEIYDIVKQYKYSLLAYSEMRLFRIITDKSEDFLNRYGSKIRHMEEVTERRVQANTNDPLLSDTSYSYKLMNINKAWDFTTGKNDVIVAVLDTGIERSHEDFTQTRILPGYDTTTNKAYVNTDYVGHGTAVSGLIAATANNGLGSAGVSYGATILPIKVAGYSVSISSDCLVSGLYFAVNAGATVINMSFGGFSKSTIEEEAVKFALENGCILVASAGNEGDIYTSAAYPASYDGVISVGAVNENGIVWNKSQHNEFVDVVAPGVNIPTMSYIDGMSKYIRQSGTSFSTAYVSGIAALASSYIDDKNTLRSREFMTLIKNTGGKWNEYYGYGIINAYKIIEKVNLPIISGVSDGETYFESVKINFNKGTVTLDGELIYDGEVVFENGRHILAVTYGESYKAQITFNIENKPLTYQFKEESDYAYFTFERGNATVDGIPYLSGQPISSSGDHIFVLSGKYSNSVEKKFTLNLDIPYVVGVSDGMTYDSAVCIRIIGNGVFTLDEKQISAETVVDTPGDHTLIVLNSGQTKSRIYRFRINNQNVDSFNSDMKNAAAIVDIENGYVIRYSSELKGIRVYNINSPDNFVRFLSVGTVRGYAFYDQYLLLYHDNTVTRLTRSRVLNQSNPVDSVYKLNENISACVLVGNDLYYASANNLKRFNLSSQQKWTVEILGITPDTSFLSQDKKSIYMFDTSSGEKKMSVIDIDSGVSDTVTIPVSAYNKKIVYGSGLFAIGDSLIGENNYHLKSEYSASPVLISGNLLITRKGIISISTNEQIALFSGEISNIIIGSNNSVYVFYNDGRVQIVKNDSNPVTDYNNSRFGAAPVDETIAAGGVKQNDYTSFAVTFSQRKIIASAVYGNWIYLICDQNPMLYKLDAKTFMQVDAIPLKYLPSKVSVSGEKIIIGFKNAPFVCVSQASAGTFGDENYFNIGFVPQQFSAAKDKIALIKNGYVMIYDLLTQTINSTNIRASFAEITDDTMYTANGSFVFMHDLTTLATKGSITCNGTVNSFGLSGPFMFTSDKIYSLENKTLVYGIGDPVLAMRGNSIITSKGVFSLRDGVYLSSYTTNGKYHYFDNSFNYYAVSDNTIVRAVSASGRDLTEFPVISGIAQGGNYPGAVSIGFDFGMGFIDSKRIESGMGCGEGYEHVFTIVLSCGISKQIEFTCAPALSGIEILGGNRTINVNDTITLQVKFLPLGTSSVDLVFETKDTDIIRLSQNGEITALREGVARIKVLTLVSDISAECTITVSKSLLKFNPSSQYKVDRNNMLVTGVKAGTSASQVLASLANEAKAVIMDTSGNILEEMDIVGTGMLIVLKNPSGEEIDKLTFSVKGDVSGDGYISADDIYAIIEAIEGRLTDQAFVLAADINANGQIANNDLTLLKKHIWYDKKIIETAGTPPYTSDTTAFSIVNTRIYDKEKVYVTIQLSGAKGIYAISGKLKYNTKLLRYVTHNSRTWNDSFFAGDGFVSFISYSPNKTGSEKNAKTLLVFEFVLKEGALGKQVLFDLSDVITVSETGSKSLNPTQALRLVHERPDNQEFELFIHNAENFVFSSETYEYNVRVKSNVAVLDIDAAYPYGGNVYVGSTIIPDDNKLSLSVLYIAPDGNTKTYVIHVVREEEFEPDRNNFLSMLEVDGFKLTPDFDKNKTSYSVTVPFQIGKLMLRYETESKNCLAELNNPHLQIGENLVRIACIAESGDVRIYTIKVIREAGSGSDPVSSEPNEVGIWRNPIFYISTSIGFMFGVATFVIIRRKRKILIRAMDKVITEITGKE